MIALLWFLLTLFASPLKSKSRLEAENAALRYQLIVLRRKVGGRVRLTNGDRLFLIQLYRWFPSVVCTENSIRIDWGGNHVTSAHNDRAVWVLLALFASPLKSKSRLEAENAALRYQL